MCYSGKCPSDQQLYGIITVAGFVIDSGGVKLANDFLKRIKWGACNAIVLLVVRCPPSAFVKWLQVLFSCFWAHNMMTNYLQLCSLYPSLLVAPRVSLRSHARVTFPFVRQ